MLARSHRRVILVSAVLFYNGLAFAADDKSTPGAVMELFGYSSDPSAASIDYHERPVLVLPPKTGELPAPKEKASESSEWPRDPGGARRRNSDRYARVPNAPPPEKKPGLLERIRGPRPEAAPGTDDEPGLLQRIITKRQTATLPMEEPSRRMLTDPPAGYRKPTMDLNSVNEAGAKKSSWLNPLGILGKDDDNDPVAQTGSQSSIESQAEGNGGFLSRITPSFMKQDKN